MQRFSRPTAFRPQINPIVSNTIPAKPKAGWMRLMSLTLCAALTTSGAVVAGSGDTDNDVAIQGHAKRYMRINEYLFHGTQKGTAIVSRVEDRSTQQV